MDDKKIAKTMAVICALVFLGGATFFYVTYSEFRQKKQCEKYESIATQCLKIFESLK